MSDLFCFNLNRDTFLATFGDVTAGAGFRSFIKFDFITLFLNLETDFSLTSTSSMEFVAVPVDIAVA